MGLKIKYTYMECKIFLIIIDFKILHYNKWVRKSTQCQQV